MPVGSSGRTAIFASELLLIALHVVLLQLLCLESGSKRGLLTVRVTLGKIGLENERFIK